MKTKLSLCLLSLLLIPVLCFGQSAVSAFTAGNSYTFGTTNFAVGSIFSANGNTPVLTYLNASTDLGSAACTFWKATNPTNAPGVPCLSNTTTVVYIQGIFDTTGTNLTTGVNTNNFAANNPVVIRHIATDTYEVRLVSAMGTNQITLNAAPTTTVANGDMMYGYSIAASIPPPGGGSTTNLTLGPAHFIAAGSKNAPMLVSINFTTAGKVNCISGSFLP